MTALLMILLVVFFVIADLIVRAGLPIAEATFR
jgi:hypothetical protein